MYNALTMNNATIPIKVHLIHSMLVFPLKSDAFTLRDEQCGGKRPDQAVIDTVDLIVSTTAALWTQLGVLVGLFGF